MIVDGLVTTADPAARRHSETHQKQGRIDGTNGSRCQWLDGIETVHSVHCYPACAPSGGRAERHPADWQPSCCLHLLPCGMEASPFHQTLSGLTQLQRTAHVTHHDPPRATRLRPPCDNLDTSECMHSAASLSALFYVPPCMTEQVYRVSTNRYPIMQCPTAPRRVLHIEASPNRLINVLLTDTN
jgi:hypothetical protein